MGTQLAQGWDASSPCGPSSPCARPRAPHHAHPASDSKQQEENQGHSSDQVAMSYTKWDVSGRGRGSTLGADGCGSCPGLCSPPGSVGSTLGLPLLQGTLLTTCGTPPAMPSSGTSLPPHGAPLWSALTGLIHG